MPKKKRGGTFGGADRRRRTEAQRRKREALAQEERRRRQGTSAGETENKAPEAVENERDAEHRTTAEDIQRRRQETTARWRADGQGTSTTLTEAELQALESEHRIQAQLRSDAEAKKRKRCQETDEERAARRRADAGAHRIRIQRENEEEAAARRAGHAQVVRVGRLSQTPDEAAAFREENANAHRRTREAETEEHNRRRLEEEMDRFRRSMDQETEEEAHERRNRDAEWHRHAREEAAIARQVETAEEREQRIVEERARHHRRGQARNLARNADTSGVQEHSCGRMDGCCEFCGGLFFRGEMTSRGTFQRCCHSGKIVEGQIGIPREMRELLTGSHALSAEFFNNIRTYNSAFSFASMGALVDVPADSRKFVFRIHGAIYHRMSNLGSTTGRAKYAQLYILDSDEALRQRMNINRNVHIGTSVRLNPDLLSLLDRIIREVNPYAEAHKMLREVEEEVLREQGPSATADLLMYIKEGEVPGGEHLGRYNAPRQNQVAAIFKSADGVPPSNRDIVIHRRDSKLTSVDSLNPNLEPMTYPLFYPCGERGYQRDERRGPEKLTELQFYSHRASLRRDIFNPVLYGRKLFQQYLVDAYVKVEGNRLAYLRINQKQLRVDSYMGLADHVRREGERRGVRAGVPIVLPSSHIGSPRCMNQNYQDSMAIVRDLGKPDLFVTFTCNPFWTEIADNLFPGQTYHDRPDVVSRVFDLKKRQLLEDLTTSHVLGSTIADIHVIEFQKRGLPHMHLLIILGQEDKVFDSDGVDSLVCAEFPDEEVDPVLHEIIKSSMVHGPCGVLNPQSPCMKDGTCTKGYPRAFCSETLYEVSGYPVYRRRDDGRVVRIRNCDIDNRWVVPYNPYLTKRYNAHINVEVCSSIKSVKYVYKGHDAARVVLERETNEGTLMWDEIRTYLNARYVSAPEAVWRLFEKRMHSTSHTVHRLPVHLEDRQPVYFVNDQEESALANATDRHTKLTGWFELNRRTDEAARYLYADIPKHYTWDKDNSSWRTRRRGVGCGISRMYSVSPRDVERFHLRLLLCHVRGAKSFADLRTYEDVQYATFKEACLARGLLEDDREWRLCLDEARQCQMPRQLRQLFVVLCVFCRPADPAALWQEFREAMSEDFAQSHSPDDSVSLALLSIEEHLRTHGASMQEFGLPLPPTDIRLDPVSPMYDRGKEAAEAGKMRAALNPEQRLVFEAVMAAVSDDVANRPKTFCVNAFAGAGKTYLFEALLHAVRGMGFVAVPVAWTGIAAVLMSGGRTVHSIFRLPVPVTETSSCAIRQDSDEARLLRSARIIVWDECTMTPYHALDAVDRILRDLMSVDVAFGGKVVLLGGDWRQTLPVVAKGTRLSSTELCLRNSNVWPLFQQFPLTANMRVGQGQRSFSEWLLELGDGRLSNRDRLQGDLIEVPPECVVDGSIVDEIYGSGPFDADVLVKKAILCPKNEDSLRINEEVLSRFPGETHALYSADSIVCEDGEEQDAIQMDFVHSLTPSGMPPHCLNLKEGAVVMLLRNMSAASGLCNGTRLIVRRVMPNVLDCEVVSPAGESPRPRVFVPRLELTSTTSDMPFTLRRRQFPVRLAFAMTINKSQGQTLARVGLFLPQPVFSHGMLYVAFSRCTTRENVRVCVKDTLRQGRLGDQGGKVVTKNVVYPEVLG